MRGEHEADGYTEREGAGSSPHARGARYAGSRVPPTRGDHPRMRGEHRYHWQC